MRLWRFSFMALFLIGDFHQISRKQAELLKMEYTPIRRIRVAVSRKEEAGRDKWFAARKKSKAWIRCKWEEVLVKPVSWMDPTWLAARREKVARIQHILEEVLVEPVSWMDPTWEEVLVEPVSWMDPTWLAARSEKIALIRPILESLFVAEVWSKPWVGKPHSNTDAKQMQLLVGYIKNYDKTSKKIKERLLQKLYNIEKQKGLSSLDIRKFMDILLCLEAGQNVGDYKGKQEKFSRNNCMTPGDFNNSTNAYGITRNSMMITQNNKIRVSQPGRRDANLLQVVQPQQVSEHVIWITQITTSRHDEINLFIMSHRITGDDLFWHEYIAREILYMAFAIILIMGPFARQCSGGASIGEAVTVKTGAKKGSPPTAPKEETGDVDKPRCLVCKERQVDTLAMPCGHLAMCHFCASKKEVCPRCSAPIRATCRAYFK